MKWTFFLFALSLGCAWADDWPQWFGAQRDGIWREKGIVKTLPKSGPPLVWKQTIGNGYAGPAVADGKVFVLDRQVAKDAPDRVKRGQGTIPGHERVLCLDEATGEELWSYRYASDYSVQYASGPRCAPTVDGDKVYALGAEGHLHCLQVADGKVVWAKNFLKELQVKAPVWGFAGSPLVDDDLIICLARGDGSTAIAFDKVTGDERWRALAAKEPGYCPPSIITHGGVRALILWHAEAINALEPKTGKVLWSLPWKIKAALTAPTPQHRGQHLFFTSFYNGSTMLKLGATAAEKPEVLWQTERESERRTTHLNSIIGTPAFTDGHLYGGCSYGQFRCLRASDGARLWEDLKPIVGKEERWANVFVTPHEDRYFLFNEQGELIIAKLSPKGYEETSRAKLIEPNGIDLRRRPIVWSHPAYANQRIYVRNDGEIRCYSLRADS